MIVLLVGLICFLAALRAFRGGREPGTGTSLLPDVRGGGALAWFALVALLTLAQLWSGRDELDRYRFTLLGLRYRIAGVGGEVLQRAVTVGGDDAAADVLVPGAGETPPLRLVPVGDSALREVAAVAVPDAGAVGLVEVGGVLGSEWVVPGAVAVGPGTRIVVRSAGGERRIELGDTVARIDFVDAEIPLPWVRQPVARVSRAGGAAASRVELPAVSGGSLLARLVARRPSIFQRTYPVADVLERADPGAVLPPLGSFFFWREGELHLADLDSELTVEGGAPAGAAAGADSAGTTADSAPSLPVWRAGEGGRRVLVAGLPHRDYPEPDLVLPERYGLRPLRSFGVSVHEGWLDVTLGSSEVRALDRAALDELRLPGSRDEAGNPVYRIRLTPGRNASSRRSVVFDAAPAHFETSAQAVFRLPEDPTAGAMDLLTPSGLTRWETGRPLALGTGDRSLLVRVDGQGTSAVFWLVHVALMAMAGAVFLLRPASGPVFALALTAAGFACVRLLLGVSALAAYPYVQEGQQIGLWLLPFLPWVVVTLAEVFRPGPARSALLTFRSWRGWAFQVGYAVALVALSGALFSASPAKQLVLGALPVVVTALWLAARSGWRPWQGLGARAGRFAADHPRLAHGWVLGAALLLLRIALEGAGWREQLTVGGTRIGVSVFYTPLALVAFAFLVWRHDRRIRESASAGELPVAVARALLEVGGFLFLAFVAVSGWVSDFGIALVLLPGPLVLLLRLGVVRAPAGRPGRLTVLALSAPLLLFALLQAAPPLLRFAWGGEVHAADARMGDWNRNELLLLERGDPATLALIGERRSEALAVMRQTMRSYTRGNPFGKGFLEGRVSDEIADTATREHVVSALLASQWGLPGAGGLVLLLLSLLPPVTRVLGPPGEGSEPDPRDEGVEPASVDAGARGAVRPSTGEVLVTVGAPLAILVLLAHLLPSPFNTVVVGLLVAGALVVLLGPAFEVAERAWREEGRGDVAERAPGPAGAPVALHRVVAAVALYTMAFAGIYMVLANYGLVFFTGKNVYLLGLDSVGDVLESLALLALAASTLAVDSEEWAPAVERGLAGGGHEGAGSTGGPARAVAVGPPGAAGGGDGSGEEEWWRTGGGER